MVAAISITEALTSHAVAVRELRLSPRLEGALRIALSFDGFCGLASTHALQAETCAAIGVAREDSAARGGYGRAFVRAVPPSRHVAGALDVYAGEHAEAAFTPRAERWALDPELRHRFGARDVRRVLRILDAMYEAGHVKLVAALARTYGSRPRGLGQVRDQRSLAWLAGVFTPTGRREADNLALFDMTPSAERLALDANRAALLESARATLEARARVRGTAPPTEAEIETLARERAASLSQVTPREALLVELARVSTDPRRWVRGELATKLEREARHLRTAAEHELMQRWAAVG